jgi:hypothetical protein
MILIVAAGVAGIEIADQVGESAANSLGRLADITAFIGVNSREWVNKGLNPRSGKGQ